MRYFIVNYYQKANGQIDEVTAVTKNVKMRDHQSASVILDFKTLTVVKASMGGTVIPRDFDRIVQTYYQHYPHVIERLFKENGYDVKVEPTEKTDTD